MALMDSDVTFPRTGEIVEVDSSEAQYVLGMVASTDIESYLTGTVRRIQGGVSSDVWLLECIRKSGVKRYVIKQPLAILRVQKKWSAPLERSQYEYLWLKMAAQVSAQSVPEVCYFDAERPLLITQYIDAAEASVWQMQLFSGDYDLSFARLLGFEIARFHKHTANNEFYERQFNSSEILRATRIDPYIFALIDIYPSLRERFIDIGESVLANRIVVIHGDLSPKNILCRFSKPVFLDAECACYADPAFDIAFCLNHLIIKYFRLGDARLILLARILSMVYLDNADWEDRKNLEQRIANLIPVMMLARIDGKSTLNYLNDYHKTIIRKKALALFSKYLFSLDFVFNEVAFSL